jgi:hypothetical protein
VHSTEQVSYAFSEAEMPHSFYLNMCDAQGKYFHNSVFNLIVKGQDEAWGSIVVKALRY